jgi:hypothetical protein
LTTLGDGIGRSLSDVHSSGGKKVDYVVVCRPPPAGFRTARQGHHRLAARSRARGAACVLRSAFFLSWWCLSHSRRPFFRRPAESSTGRRAKSCASSCDASAGRPWQFPMQDVASSQELEEKRNRKRRIREQGFTRLANVLVVGYAYRRRTIGRHAPCCKACRTCVQRSSKLAILYR